MLVISPKGATSLLKSKSKGRQIYTLDVIMNKPDKQLNTETSFVLKEGQLGCLSGDKRCFSCPSLGSEELVDSQLDVLADIIFEQFLLENNKKDAS